MSSTAIPDPGVYHGVPMDTYLSWDAVSASRISQACRSLAHYRANVGPEETDEMRFGVLAHCGVLEPAAVAERYAVMPAFELDPCNATGRGEPSQSKLTTYYRRAAAEWEAANAGKVRIDQVEYDNMRGIVAALARHERAAACLNGGQSEVCLVWLDHETGLPCKARLDCFQPDRRIFSDLKTTRDALRFDASIVNLGYHRQMAHYQDGLAALMSDVCLPHLIAVETSPPYGIRAAPLAAELLSAGHQERREQLSRIAHAIEADEWPGYASPDWWTGPAWYTSGRHNDQSIADWIKEQGD